MSIRGQIVGSSFAALLFLAVLIAALISRAHEMSEELEHRHFTDYLERSVADLRWLAVETALNHAPRSEEQWRGRHQDVVRAIQSHPMRHVESNRLVLQISESVSIMDTLYSRMSTLDANGGDQEERDLKERTVSNIMVISHQLRDLIRKLVAERREIVSARESRSTLLIGSMLVIVAFLVLMLVAVMQQRVLRPISRLQEATAIIAGGDLSHRVNPRTGGEVANLARAFDQMTAALEHSARSLDAARRESVEDGLRLERLNAFQRTVFDQAPDGILVSDASGRIIDANDRVAALFGWTRDLLRERSVDDLVPTSLQAGHQTHRHSYHQRPSTRPMSSDRFLEGQRADGSTFPIEVALSPMHTSDGFRVIAIVKDVTAARRAEQAVRDALKEKDLLLGEIHHRVKNNLQIVHSLLDMQVQLTADVHAAGALRDSQNRIQSMALIHQTLYQSQNFAKVDFGQFLETLTRHLHNSYGRSEVLISSHSQSVSLPIDRAIPCGLIVNELVTNSLKHAFPAGRAGHVNVEMRLVRDLDVEVVVADDGIGLPASFDLNSGSSLGMQLVQLLLEQLHAEYRIQSRAPAQFAFTFPLEDAS